MIHNIYMEQETITAEEALWTQEALGINDSSFARLLNVSNSTINSWRKRPRAILKADTALLLTLATNRLTPNKRGRH